MRVELVRTDEERLAMAEATFVANLENGGLSDATITRTFEIEDDTVVAAAQMDMSTSLMSLTSIDSMTLKIGTEVAVPGDKKAEIALVLDYSGSMNETIAVSMALRAVPSMINVQSLRVSKTPRYNCIVSRIIWRNCGSNCPSNCDDMARSTRGSALIGPGPIRRRGNGLRSVSALARSDRGEIGGKSTVMVKFCIHNRSPKYTRRQSDSQHALPV